ncbi:MAG: hypothetical protein CMK33_05615 [Porticoccaceae bacterium]|nr:hypothetical protein [Porticoccaceae bacterium]
MADAGETGSLVFGQDFGIVTDMEIGPDGALYVTSLTQGAVYRVSAVPEPALATMFAGGLVLLCLAHIKRSRAGLVRACPVA